MDMHHSHARTIEIPWRALLASVGCGLVSLCAWIVSGVDLVLLVGITGSTMLSCLAQERAPAPELRAVPRARRSRRIGARPHVDGPAPAGATALRIVHGRAAEAFNETAASPHECDRRPATAGPS